MPFFEFNKSIIDATQDLCVSYKLNTAFYEAMGAKGWDILERTFNYIPATHFKIADAKRGDIGNTSTQYAKAFFEAMNADAITVAPYMGEDSVRPFLQFNNKWAIVLGLTSNSGAKDFELQQTGNEMLYEKVLRAVAGWGNANNLMFVIGATRPGTFFRLDVNPGRHVLHGTGIDIGEYQLDTRPGHVYYVSHEVNGGHSRYRLMPEKVAQAEVRSCCALLENWAPGQRPIPIVLR